ncbi:MAG: type I restriction-modification system endonuclease [Christensenellaceae bacterium]|jgi:type I restriction enzyme R subunit|nr:type I restriction-modification system endonuclease [Christensenellaceae bacterium]
MSNFIFLKGNYPELFKLAFLAEQNYVRDTQICVSKLGVFLESITKYICAYEQIELLYGDTQTNRLRELKYKSILSRDIEEVFHVVRKMRNKVQYENYDPTQSETTNLLGFCFDIAIWFFRNYADNKASTQIFSMAKIKFETEEQLSAAKEKIGELGKQLAKIRSVKTKHLFANFKFANTTKTEAQTRMIIDEQLNKAGWLADTTNLTYRNGTRPEKGKNIAIAEWPTDSALKQKGFADYALFIGERLYAIVEAKKESEDVAATIDVQAKDYAKNIKPEHSNYALGNWNGYQVPFLFATNSRPYSEAIPTQSGIWFLDARKNYNNPYSLTAWFSPLDLEEKYKMDIASANETLKEENTNYLEDKDGLNLRDYQIKAIAKITDAIIEGKKEMLLVMATGTGKTRTILGLIYRMLETNRFKRILFLVDRNSLGAQAQDVFKEVILKDLLTLDKIYSINNLENKDVDSSTRVSVATIQSMVRRVILTNEPFLLAGSYDLIIVDEAHRGYTLDRELSEDEQLYKNETDYLSKYKQVIEYFDAVKVALTATPALHTTEIFGKPIFTYSYREAVIDGWLVDHEPPVKINTTFNTQGLTIKSGDQLAIIDPITNEVANLEDIDDELDFEVDDFNRLIVVPHHTETVLKQVSQYLDPESDEKTLIFAVDDKHADQIVDTLRKIYQPQQIDNDAIMKITGKTASGDSEKIGKIIKQYKNNQYPNIAVTVDLLSTGINVPKICNIVFMRRIRSRILFEQMMGRATRQCKEIGKTHFSIYDAVQVYENLIPLSNMKPVAPSATSTMAELARSLSLVSISEELRKDNIKKIIAKINRKLKGLSDNQSDQIEEYIGISINDYVGKIKNSPIYEAIELLTNDIDFLLFIENIKEERKQGKFVTDKKDTLLETTYGYGSTDKPQDYIDSFSEFIKSNYDSIEALKIICTNPAELTKSQLRALNLKLSENKFDQTSLNKAWSQLKNEEIITDIINLVRQVVLDESLFHRPDWINAAFVKLRKNHSFNKIQQNLLDKIQVYITHAGMLNKETFDAPQFRDEGGFRRFDIKFEGKLSEIIKEINTYIYESKGVT